VIAHDNLLRRVCRQYDRMQLLRPVQVLQHSFDIAE
jgi:hypothetical protein